MFNGIVQVTLTPEGICLSLSKVSPRYLTGLKIRGWFPIAVSLKICNTIEQLYLQEPKGASLTQMSTNG